MDIIPYVSINPSRLCYYRRVDRYSMSRSSKENRNLINLSLNDHYGVISSKARNRIKTAIDWMLYLAKDKKHFSEKSGKYFKFKLTFVTLTLASAQIHTDNEIKEKLLNQFLVEARKKWKVDRYLWRAESQKNGNIHFHVLTDKFIPWDELRKTWNRIQDKLGYVDRYSGNQRILHKDGFRYRPELEKIWSYEKQKKAYKKGVTEGWNNPNSSDIHSIVHVRNLSAYLAKYCAKNDVEQQKAKENVQTELEFDGTSGQVLKTSELSKKLKNRIIEGKLWRLSQSLSKLKSATDLCDSKVESELMLIFRKFKDSVKNYDWNTNIYVPIYVWSKMATPTLMFIFQEYVKEMSPD